ncbi:MAG: single-stranded DNA-binding protein [Thermoanaerobaculia bacterium]|nr:single-stranded DNA-binding protein [Thermoanaerobaculia bacterium]
MSFFATWTKELSHALAELSFSPPVAHVYNPLVYARRAHLEYLDRFGSGTKEVVFLGMNPGPWGMVQTGVPFGEVELVRDWLGIDDGVDPPQDQHPKRPIEGFDCSRSEVSGRRLWGWVADRYGEPGRFFERHFVANYCPLAFLEESGRNLTPDRLRVAERKPLLAICDRALERLIAHLAPRRVIGVGRFAERRARAALESTDVAIGCGLHPSPASPAANRGWEERWERDLAEAGVELPASAQD